MRYAVLALAIAGCSREADLVFEIHRSSATSVVSVDVCDATRLEDCDTPDMLRFGAGIVHELGIYLDDTITPPLSVVFQQVVPGICRRIELEPAREPSTIIVEFREAPADLLVTGCTTCVQMPCPES